MGQSRACFCCGESILASALLCHICQTWQPEAGIRRCSACAEWILAQAKKCKHCYSDVTPVEVASFGAVGVSALTVHSSMEASIDEVSQPPKFASPEYAAVGQAVAEATATIGDMRQEKPVFTDEATLVSTGGGTAFTVVGSTESVEETQEATEEKQVPRDFAPMAELQVEVQTETRPSMPEAEQGPEMADASEKTALSVEEAEVIAKDAVPPVDESPTSSTQVEEAKEDVEVAAFEVIPPTPPTETSTPASTLLTPTPEPETPEASEPVNEVQSVIPLKEATEEQATASVEPETSGAVIVDAQVLTPSPDLSAPALPNVTLPQTEENEKAIEADEAAVASVVDAPVETAAPDSLAPVVEAAASEAKVPVEPDSLVAVKAVGEDSSATVPGTTSHTMEAARIAATPAEQAKEPAIVPAPLSPTPSMELATDVDSAFLAAIHTSQDELDAAKEFFSVELPSVSEEEGEAKGEREEAALDAPVPVVIASPGSATTHATASPNIEDTVRMTTKDLSLRSTPADDKVEHTLSTSATVQAAAGPLPSAGLSSLATRPAETATPSSFEAGVSTSKVPAPDPAGLVLPALEAPSMPALPELGSFSQELAFPELGSLSQELALPGFQVPGTTTPSSTALRSPETSDSTAALEVGPLIEAVPGSWEDGDPVLEEMMQSLEPNETQMLEVLSLVKRIFWSPLRESIREMSTQDVVVFLNTLDLSPLRLSIRDTVQEVMGAVAAIYDQELESIFAEKSLPEEEKQFYRLTDARRGRILGAIRTPFREFIERLEQLDQAQEATLSMLVESFAEQKELHRPLLSDSVKETLATVEEAQGIEAAWRVLLDAMRQGLSVCDGVAQVQAEVFLDAMEQFLSQLEPTYTAILNRVLEIWSERLYPSIQGL